MRQFLANLSKDETFKLVSQAAIFGGICGLAVVGYEQGLKMLSVTILNDWLQVDFHAMPFVSLPETLKTPARYLPLVVAVVMVMSVFIMQRVFKGVGPHSTDRVIDAFHNQNGALPLKLAVAVVVASLLTVGFGGSAGREAQAGLIGAAVAVWLGQVLGVHTKNRRLMLLIGLSAGFSAAFKTPLGAAFIAIEILYRDMSVESEALLYTIVAAVVAYVVSGSITGWEAELVMDIEGGFERARDFMMITGLGIVAGVFAAFTPTVYFRIRDVLQRPAARHPYLVAAGAGILVGCIGLLVPQTIGDGTQNFGEGIWLELPVYDLVAIAFLKLVAVALTLGAGGVGGVLSPTLVIGGAIGAAFAKLTGLPVIAMTAIGMSMVFAAVARVPIGTILMVTELTGSYVLLPAAALGVAITYFIQYVIAERLTYPSLHGLQPPTIWKSPAHQDQVLEAGLGLLQRGGIELPEGLQLPDLRALLSIGYPIRLGHGDLILFTANLSADSKAVGHALNEVPFGEGVFLLEIRHGDQPEQPQRDSVLQAEDTVVLMLPLSKLVDLQDKIAFPPVFKNWLARHEPEVYAICFGEEAD